LPNILKSPARNYFDRKRNEFLASIYTEKFGDAERIYREIFEKIDVTEKFSEVDQKAVNQIQHVFRTFRKQITANCSENIKEIFERVRKTLARAVRAQIDNVEFVEFEEWSKNLGLSKNQFRIMLETVATLQITVGCSISCRRCNEWALPGPRKHFSFDAATRLIKELFEVGNSEFALYCASDPLDWKCGARNIADILEFMSDHGYKPQYGLLTKVPRGSEKTIETLLKTGADIGFSISDKNRSKVERLKNVVNKKLDVQHDTDALLIPSGLDEDFESIKSSITDSYGCEITPEGAFIVIPTFTSALNLTGQCRVPVTADAELFLKKKVGRDALPVEYFKPLEAIDLKGRAFIPGELCEAQIENIMLDNGSEELTPPGMMNMHEYFKTYEPEAVRRRKHLFPLVSRGLVKDILFQEKYRGDSREGRYSHFKQCVLDYFETCRMSNVVNCKKNAFSFYLKSIADYLKIHPVEREIILYLRKGDRVKYEKGRHDVFEENSRGLDCLLEEPETDTFDLFQILMFMLLNNPENKTIQTFIEKNPALGDDFL